MSSGLSTSITTTGGRLKIYMRGGADNGSFNMKLEALGAVTALLGTITAVVGPTTLQRHIFGAELLPTSSANWIFEYPTSMFTWHAQPAAGTYTVKLQAQVGSTMRMWFQGPIALVIEEYGD